jgi:hypothetical protein
MPPLGSRGILSDLGLGLVSNICHSGGLDISNCAVYQSRAWYSHSGPQRPAFKEIIPADNWEVMTESSGDDCGASGDYLLPL